MKGNTEAKGLSRRCCPSMPERWGQGDEGDSSDGRRFDWSELRVADSERLRRASGKAP